MGEKLMAMENHTVLIVDDESTNLKLMDRLVKQSFRTITAASGEEALEILQREEVSMLITDQCMPGISGTELHRKAILINPDMICLLMTASYDKSALIDAMVNSGAVGVINKPWDPVKVMEVITDAIEKYEYRLKSKQSFNKLKRAIDAFDRVANEKEPSA
jgi:response regulator RpfG family c-di-GMP phosphodiesterase